MPIVVYKNRNAGSRITSANHHHYIALVLANSNDNEMFGMPVRFFVSDFSFSVLIMFDHNYK